MDTHCCKVMTIRGASRPENGSARLSILNAKQTMQFPDDESIPMEIMKLIGIIRHELCNSTHKFDCKKALKKNPNRI